MAKKITKIPATLNRFNLEPVVAIRKRRVAGYARVSTDRDEQATSYEAQMAYYKAYIENREIGNLLECILMRESVQPIPKREMALSR